MHLPTLALESFIRNQLEENPVLEEGADVVDEETFSNETENEYGGLIYQLDGKWYYTAPRTDNQKKFVYPGGPKNEEYQKLPKGAKVTAFYHTHPDAYDDNFVSDWFHPGDRSESDRTNLNGYMANGGDGVIQVYRPRLDLGKDKGKVEKLKKPIPVIHKKDPNRPPRKRAGKGGRGG